MFRVARAIEAAGRQNAVVILLNVSAASHWRKWPAFGTNSGPVQSMHAAAAFHGNDGSTTWSSGPYSTSVGTGVRSNRRGTSSIGRRPVVCSYTHQLARSFAASAYGSVWNATSSGVNAFGVPQSRWPYIPAT